MTAAELDRLIEELRRLQLTVSADLSAAAGALDELDPRVARDILAGDHEELLRFSQLIAATSGRPRVSGTVGAAATRADTQPLPRPLSRARRPSRRRALLVAPAVPLVGALAITAAVAVVRPAMHQASHRPAATATTRANSVATTSPQLATAAARHTLRRLETVLDTHPGSDQVSTVSGRLHAQLAAILAAEPDNPQDRSMVQTMLGLEQRALERHPTAVAAAALRASLHLTDRLLLVTAAPPSGRSRPAPTATTPARTPHVSRRAHPRGHVHHHRSQNPPHQVPTTAPGAPTPLPLPSVPAPGLLPS